MGKTKPDSEVLKGRGATSNATGRYNITQSEMDEGWRSSSPETVFYREQAKSIITRNGSPDVPFEFSINPYRGCEHGCIYCFARPNHAYVDLSPGLDFETKIFIKETAASCLESAFNKQGYRPEPITLGTATDPYQPVERRSQVTRSLLAVLLQYRHPFSLITKSSLVVRDADLLEQAAALGLVKVMISVTTLDNTLKARLEPRTASGASRIRTIEQLTQRGIPVGVLMAPLIPWLNDSDIEAVVQRSADAGAESANYILLRLPLEVAPLFEQWLQAHYPARAQRILNTIRSCRGGKLYQAGYGDRMRGRGQYSDLYRARFKLACERAGIAMGGDRVLDTSQFNVPGLASQLSLF